MEHKHNNVSTYLSDADHAALQALTVRLGVGTSCLLRYMIKYHLQQAGLPARAGGLGSVTPLLERLTLDELKISLELFERAK